jgi:Na+-transporting NADH:ubiquinone oxidoreductase subunit C
VSSESTFNPNSLVGTVVVALVLCVVCSLVVSGAAVGLRPRIQENKQLKIQRNVLAAAGLWEEGMGPKEVQRAFESIKEVLVTLPRYPGDEAEPGTANTLLGDGFDPRKAASDPKLSVEIPAELDIAKIRRREIAAPVFQVLDDNGQVEQYVFPVRGKGLWSTLWGFLALDSDLQTVRGITFYEHGETPGLGGEVDNPVWKKTWEGKLAVDESGNPQIDVVKGRVDPSAPGADSKIDGLSGATITAVGVEHLVNYWLGPDAFGPYIKRIQNQQ